MRYDRATLYQLAAREDPEPPVDWDHKIRKISVSNDWPRSIAGDREMFEWVDPETGEILEYDRRKRQQAYGRMYRIINSRSKRMMIRWGRRKWVGQLRAWIELWEPIARYQRLQAQYGNPGEGWAGKGYSWQKVDETYWERVYQVNGVLQEAV